MPKVGWPNLLPGGFDAGSDLDLDKLGSWDTTWHAQECCV